LYWEENGFVLYYKSLGNPDITPTCLDLTF
jgi:hypothetical protein